VIFIGDSNVGKISIFKLYMHHKVDLKTLHNWCRDEREYCIYTPKIQMKKF
uniref:Uncharacterized protein n=1 Tax=Amphimedon queenslandica TaxID=400682 RepID=A0A1X7UWB7_AMPQE